MSYARRRRAASASLQRDQPPVRSRGLTPPPGLGNRALGRLLATAPDVLAAEPSFANVAGNRAVQRMVNPAQRIEDEELTPVATQQPAGQQGLANTPPNAAPNVAHSVAVTNSAAFRQGTTGLDAVGIANGGVSAANAGMSGARLIGAYGGDTVSEMAQASGLPNLLPGVGLGLNALGAVESGYRSQKAGEAADAMDTAVHGGRRGEQTPGPRAQEIVHRGAMQTRDESERQGWNTGANVLQAGATAAAIGLGVTTLPGAALLLGSGALGVMKGAVSAKKGFDKHLGGGKEIATANAMQVLSDAVAGNPATQGMLARLGISTDNLHEKEEWDRAVSLLRDVMPNDSAQYVDGGSGVAGDSVAIDHRAPTTPTTYGSASSDDVVDPDLFGNPMAPTTAAAVVRQRQTAPSDASDTDTDLDDSATSPQALASLPPSAHAATPEEIDAHYGRAALSPSTVPRIAPLRAGGLLNSAATAASGLPNASTAQPPSAFSGVGPDDVIEEDLDEPAPSPQLAGLGLGDWGF